MSDVHDEPLSSMDVVAMVHAQDAEGEQQSERVSVECVGRVGDGAGDPLANPATVASAVELNFDELGPDFPPALRSVPALEAFFARVERLGPGGVDAETRGILVRFFPDVWSFLREHAPRDGGGGRLQLGGQGGEEQAGGGGGGEEGGGGDGGGGGGGDDASLAAEPAPPG